MFVSWTDTHTSEKIYEIKEELVVNIHTIDAKTLQKLFLAGANRINSQKEYINELNVFPVPDGDTGTNMSLTILSAAKEV